MRDRYPSTTCSTPSASAAAQPAIITECRCKLTLSATTAELACAKAVPTACGVAWERHGMNQQFPSLRPHHRARLVIVRLCAVVSVIEKAIVVRTRSLGAAEVDEVLSKNDGLARLQHDMDRVAGLGPRNPQGA